MTTSDVQYLLRCEKDINPSIRRTCLSFSVWFRKYMEFPIKVIVYLKKVINLKPEMQENWQVL